MGFTKEEYELNLKDWTKNINERKKHIREMEEKIKLELEIIEELESYQKLMRLKIANWEDT